MRRIPDMDIYPVKVLDRILKKVLLLKSVACYETDATFSHLTCRFYKSTIYAGEKHSSKKLYNSMIYYMIKYYPRPMYKMVTDIILRDYGLLCGQPFMISSRFRDPKFYCYWFLTNINLADKCAIFAKLMGSTEYNHEFPFELESWFTYGINSKTCYDYHKWKPKTIGNMAELPEVLEDLKSVDRIEDGEMMEFIPAINYEIPPPRNILILAQSTAPILDDLK